MKVIKNIDEIRGGDVLIYTGRTGNSVNWTFEREYNVFNYGNGKLYIWTDTEDVYFLSDHEEYISAYFELKEKPEAKESMSIVDNTKTYYRLKIYPEMRSNARVNDDLLNYFLSFYDFGDTPTVRDSKGVYLQGWITNGNKRKLLDEIGSFLGLEAKEW